MTYRRGPDWYGINTALIGCLAWFLTAILVILVLAALIGKPK